MSVGRLSLATFKCLHADVVDHLGISFQSHHYQRSATGVQSEPATARSSSSLLTNFFLAYAIYPHKSRSTSPLSIDFNLIDLFLVYSDQVIHSQSPVESDSVDDCKLIGFVVI